MKTICKIAVDAVCPKGAMICCGECEEHHTCLECCPMVTENRHHNCQNAESVTNELAAFQTSVPDTIGQITELIRIKKQLDEQEKLLKQELVEAMEAYGIKKFENEQITMTYVAPTTRSTIDGARLKKDHPDIAEQYSKTSNVSASVRVTLKGGDKR